MHQQTWLDWYIMGLRAKLPKALQKKLRSDKDAAFYTSMCAMNEFAKNGLNNLSDHDRTFFILSGCITVLCNPDPDRANETWAELLDKGNGKINGLEEIPIDYNNVCGIQPTAELVHDLSDAKPPAQNGGLSAMANGTWYVDMPDKTLMLNANTQIRAVFTQPAPNNKVVALAIVTPPGSNKMLGRITWTIDPDVTCEEFVQMPGLEGAAQRVSDFLVLLHLYRNIATEEDKAELPRLDESRLEKLSAKKAKNLHKQASIFRIVRLSPPADRFGKPTGATHESWKLDHRVKVKAHFRLQPHGPKFSLRKLMWIAVHWRGPEDGEEKIDLLKLRKP